MTVTFSARAERRAGDDARELQRCPGLTLSGTPVLVGQHGDAADVGAGGDDLHGRRSAT